MPCKHCGDTHSAFEPCSESIDAHRQREARIRQLSFPAQTLLHYLEDGYVAVSETNRLEKRRECEDMKRYVQELVDAGFAQYQGNGDAHVKDET